MGKIEGISIKNYGSLKNVTLGKTRTHQANKPLSNMTAIIGPSGNGWRKLREGIVFSSLYMKYSID